MNSIHETSLQLIEELFNSMDDETFLREYHSVERGVGPTVDSFLASYRSLNGFLKTSEIVVNYVKHCEVKERSYTGQNSVYSIDGTDLQQAA